MRGFIITILLFLALVACIIINYNYVNGVHGEMYDLASKLTREPSKENEEIINELSEYFESNVTFLEISVSARDIDNLINAIDCLYASNSSGNEVQLAINIEVLLNAIDVIKKLETLSLKNIL